MSEIVTSLLKAVVGLLVKKVRDSAAEKLKDGDVTDKKIRELMQREINDIKSKLDAMTKKDLLTAIDTFEAGLRYLYKALDIDSETIRSPTEAIEPAIQNVGMSEFGDEAKELLIQAKERFKMAREEATRAFNTESLDTLQRITAIQNRVMAAMLESVAKSLAATTDLPNLSLKSALQSATPECEQSLRQLHSLPDVKKNFEVELRSHWHGSGLFNIRGRFGREERREIIYAVCQVNRFIHDAQEFDFDHYDWAAIKIGEKSINPLYSREVREVLDEAGIQHSCVQIEWSFGDNGEEGHRLSNPHRIATNTLGEFLVLDWIDDDIKVFDSSGEFIYKINPQVDDNVRIRDLVDVGTDENNKTYMLVWLSESGYDTWEVQVFTKTEMCNKFPVRDKSYRLTVIHDRVFVASWNVIAVYERNGVRVGSFEVGIIGRVIDIAAGSDGQIFVLECKGDRKNIAYVFTDDGHQQNKFRVDNKEDDYSGLASYPSGEYIVLSGVERKTGRLKVAMHRKDGVFNRSVTLGKGRLEANIASLFGIPIAVTNDGSVAISFRDQEDRRNVIVRPMKPC
ncbi:uncharacterized protein [Acropora muricata]|uniref:uncharacterized protein n=1 Tax=Acropora muricata TaxID=159855 RepID=UPI0034E3E6B7